MPEHDAVSRERLDYLTRALFSGVCAVILAYVAWMIVSRFLHIIILLSAAALLAFVISPLVDRLNRWMPRLLAVACAYLGIAAVLVGGGYLLFGPVVAQLSEAVVRLPGQNARLEQQLQNIDAQLAGHGVQLHLAASLRNAASIVQTQSGLLLSRTLDIASSVLSIVLDMLLCLVISIYLVLDGRRIHDAVMRLVPDRQRERVFFVEAAINTVVGGYVRGQLVLEATIGSLVAAGCWWLGLPYPVLLGIAAALLELVPMLGPMLSAIPALTLAAISPHPGEMVIKVLLYFFLIQQFETNVLSPRVMGHAVGLHPVAAIVALLVGANLGGAIGAIVAAPMAGLLYVLAAALFWHLKSGRMPEQRRRRPVLVSAGSALRRRARPSGAREAVAAPPARVQVVEEVRDQLIERFEQSTQDVATPEEGPAHEEEPPREHASRTQAS